MPKSTELREHKVIQQLPKLYRLSNHVNSALTLKAKRGTEMSSLPPNSLEVGMFSACLMAMVNVDIGQHCELQELYPTSYRPRRPAVPC